MKKILIHIRASMKFFILLGIAFFIVIGIIIAVYKPMYVVTLNGETLGYTQDKSLLQNRINAYMKEGSEDLVAFVEIDEMPEYQMCLLKRDTEDNTEEIFSKITGEGTSYYKYYAILDGDEEKYYVSSYSDVESILSELEERDSSNIDDISYKTKYETEIKEFTSVDDAVADLYVEPKKVQATTSYSGYSYSYSSYDYDNGSYSADIGISLMEPIDSGYVISSRFGYRSSGNHTGLDIAISSGTPIEAAASGIVTYSGWKGSYGNCVVISHGNGVETYYAHCSELYVDAGEYVSQGDVISAVGSTGNSTGPHLHLEVRLDGVPQDPQSYVY